ncbi:MAG: FAD-dependent oxidoreductase [Burkholderiaceae bacterium]
MKRLLLAGGGHSHVFVLDALARRPPHDVEVTLVSPFDRQVYSGMLPGWIAGHYQIDQCVIPLAPLAQRAGARFVQAHVARLDLDGRVAYTEASEPLPFDVVSIATGPVMNLDAITGLREHAIALRPIESLIRAWPRLLTQILALAEAGNDTATVTVVGGGAGGVELALAIAHRTQIAYIPARVQLVTGKPGLLPAFADGVRRRIARLLPVRGVRLIEDDAAEITRHTVVLADGGEIASDLTIAATGAAAAEWPREAGLAVDERGFIAVDERLQSISHPFVFAAGDCASIVGHPRPKSGVYAVRAGPPLARNLLRHLAGRRLRRYRPQRVALYLLATGPQHAIASWNGLSAEGRWVWRWKDRIDRRFVMRYAR